MKNSIYLLLVVGLLGCAHTVKKRPIDQSLSYEDNMQIFKDLKTQAKENYAAFLSPEEYEQGQDIYDDFTSGEWKRPLSKEAYEEMAFGMAYFEKANNVAEKRFERHSEMMKSRIKAITAGVRFYDELEDDFELLDGKLRQEFATRTFKLKEDEANRFKKKYDQFFEDTMVMNELNQMADIDKMLKEDGVEDKLPKTHKEFSESLKLAEKAIRENPSSSEDYDLAVNMARLKTIKLYRVMNIVKNTEGDTTEAAALKIWSKNQRIAKLQNDKESLNWEINVMLDTLNDSEAIVMGQERRIDQLERKAETNLIAETLNQRLSSTDAEVLIKGDKIIVKMRSIPYELNQVTIPEQAKPNLTKLSEVIKRANPEKVIVVGHTDTVGRKNVNMKVSKKRAYNVRKFLSDKAPKQTFESKALAFNEPLKPNLSANERQINRRVDIVIVN